MVVPSVGIELFLLRLFQIVLGQGGDGELRERNRSSCFRGLRLDELRFATESLQLISDGERLALAAGAVLMGGLLFLPGLWPPDRLCLTLVVIHVCLGLVFAVWRRNWLPPLDFGMAIAMVGVVGWLALGSSPSFRASNLFSFAYLGVTLCGRSYLWKKALGRS